MGYGAPQARRLIVIRVNPYRRTPHDKKETRLHHCPLLNSRGGVWGGGGSYSMVSAVQLREDVRHGRDMILPVLRLADVWVVWSLAWSLSREVW